jgi:hypothetical protein
MKAGRNDPCPCGSGKKYKKCCLRKDQEAADLAPPVLVTPPNPDPLAAARPKPSRGARPALSPLPEPPPQPPDPAAEAWNARWKEFEAQDGEGRVAVFLKTLDDTDLMDDEMAFEMLSALHGGAAERGERQRFADLVGALRERRPELYDEGAHYYLSWLLQDALVEGRRDTLPALARELGARAGRDIDTVRRSLDGLAYHGELSALVEAMRAGWPGVKPSANILPWGIDEWAAKGVDYEVFDYLEHTASPAPTMRSSSREFGSSSRIRARTTCPGSSRI